MSGSDAAETRLRIDTDMSGHDATRRDVSEKKIEDDRGATRPDMTRHVASDSKRASLREATGSASRQVEKTNSLIANGRYQTTVRSRSLNCNDDGIGQSQTLADFMLKAQERILGQRSDPEKGKPAPPTGPNLSPTPRSTCTVPAYTFRMSCWISLASKATRLPAAMRASY